MIIIDLNVLNGRLLYGKILAACNELSGLVNRAGNVFSLNNCENDEIECAGSGKCGVVSMPTLHISSSVKNVVIKSVICIRIT